MNTTPRQILASGTAIAAVAGALLLGAEDSGRAPFTVEHAADITAGLWMPAPRVVMPVSNQRTPSDRARQAAR
ncbi:hypothetical protein [Rhizobacter sp. LjRoot28]|uniref:hypothetical protein n=1 Tax=Rhizobacter sp. LjRoot28 TaxID=3342309 RepID=UPI003ECE95B4